MQYQNGTYRISPEYEQRVFLTGCPEDVQQHFDTFAALIQKERRCIVFYENDPEHPEDPEQFEEDLSRMQLIVLLVSSQFLYTECNARCCVMKYALEQHIPVLPVLIEPKLGRVFTSVCGDLHCLDMTQHDETAHSFEEKFADHIENVLYDSKLARELRNAFDGYIFLSYRKADRREAQRLMRMIHKNTFARNIAFWYDEYLVPGEHYREAIRTAIRESDLFAMVITPKVLEADNYVMRQEYPEAVASGKTILPAMLLETDQNELAKKYINIPPCVNTEHADALTETLRDRLQHLIRQGEASLNDPERIYMLGLAYLGGVSVETDYEIARTMITDAAESRLPEAMEKIARMYSFGEGVKRDPEQALMWKRRLVQLKRERLEDAPEYPNYLELIRSLKYLAEILSVNSKSREAEEVYRELLQAEQDCTKYGIGQHDAQIEDCYIQLSLLAEENGKLTSALAYLKRAQQINENRNDSEKERRQQYYNERIGSILAAMGQQSEAEQHYLAAYEASKAHADAERSNLARGYQADRAIKLSRYYFDTGEMAKALRYAEEAAQLLEACYASFDTLYADDLCGAYHLIGSIMLIQNDPSAAQAYYEKALKLSAAKTEKNDHIQNRIRLANQHTAMANLFLKMQRLGEVQQHLDAALALQEEIAAQTDTAELKMQHAKTLRLAGECRMAQDQPDAAAPFLERAAAICGAVCEQSENVSDREEYSQILVQLGDLRLSQVRPDDARRCYEQAYSVIREDAARSDALNVQLQLAMCCDRLGQINAVQGFAEEAERYFRRAADLCRSMLEQSDIPVIMENLATAYERIGNVCTELCRTDEAEKMFLKSLKIREEHARKYRTPKSRHDLCCSYHNIGGFYITQGKPEQAQRYFENALPIELQLIGEHRSEKHTLMLSDCYERLGDIAAERSCREATAYYEKAMELLEQLAAHSDSYNVNFMLARLCFTIAAMNLRFGRLREARTYAVRSQQLHLKMLRASDQGDLLHRFADDLLLLGDISMQEGNPDAAEVQFSNALKKLREAMEKTPSPRVRWDIALCWARLGEIQLFRENAQSALELNLNALREFEQLEQLGGDAGIRNYIGLCCDRIGFCCFVLGDLDHAGEYYGKALALRTELAEQLGTAEAYDALASTHFNIADICKRRRERKAHLRQAYDIWVKLAGEFPDRPEFADRARLARKEL